MAIVGIRGFALLMRPREKKIWLARKKIKSAAKRFLAAADKSVNVVARQVTVADEEFECLDVAVGRVDDDGAAGVGDRFACPARVASSGRCGRGFHDPGLPTTGSEVVVRPI